MHTVFHTSRGWVCVSASPKGIRKLTLPRETRDSALDGLGDLTSSLFFKKFFISLEEKLQAYFDAEIVTFSETTDLEEYTPFIQSVWKSTCQIGYGQVASYSDIAVKAGSPHACRAVGQALKRNPVPIIIPCHRIIASNGLIGGFNGGVSFKQELLQLEQNGLAKTGCRY